MNILIIATLAIETAITNGASFLLSKQADDGHWSDPQMPALTALPLWALSTADLKLSTLNFHLSALKAYSPRAATQASMSLTLGRSISVILNFLRTSPICC